jgi:hypothetical protein
MQPATERAHHNITLIIPQAVGEPMTGLMEPDNHHNPPFVTDEALDDDAAITGF